MKNDKIIIAAKIAACRELFIKYKGKSHKLIECEIRELGFTDFSRRILYSRNSGRGKRDGWIAEFGWEHLAGADRSEPPALVGGTPRELAQAGADGTSVRGCSKSGIASEIVPPAHAGGSDKKGARGEPFADFQSWLKRVSPNMTWDWRHQIYLYERLKRVTDGTCKRLMIFMPPRHGKSELVTVRYVAWRMRQTPEVKVILASYGQQLANTFSRGIKRVLCDDAALEVAELQEVSELRSSKESLGKGRSRSMNTPASQNSATSQLLATSQLSMFPFTTQKPLNTAAQWGTAVGGGLRAVGVGGGITGFGADLVVIDDPVKNRAQAESETYRESVWRWYNDDLYTRLEPGAAMILIQTRWHEDDLAGRLLKQMNEGGEEWEVVDLPALAEERVLSEPPALAGGTDVEIVGAAANQSTLPHGQRRDEPHGPSPTANVPPAHAGGSDRAGGQNARAPIEKKRVIGFPRLYSHVEDAGSPPYEGGVAAASADGVVLPAADGAPVEKKKVIGFPRLYSHLESVDAGNADAGNAAALGCKADSSGLTRLADPELLEIERHHAGGTGARGEGACVPGDWRAPGDALCPERYDVPKLYEIKTQLGGYAFASLYQQHPSPADGAIFKKAWLRNVVESAPPGLRWFRGYDLAISTRTTADYTASFRVAVDDLGFMYIADGFRERIEYPDQRRFILERIRTEPGTQHGIEDSAHGKAIVQDLKTDLRMFNYSLNSVRVVGDKLTRALRWSPIAEAGKLKLVRGAWIDAFIHELIRFPLGKHDDQTDAVSIAVQMMAGMPDKKMYRF